MSNVGGTADGAALYVAYPHHMAAIEKHWRGLPFGFKAPPRATPSMRMAAKESSVTWHTDTPIIAYLWPIISCGKANADTERRNDIRGRLQSQAST